MHHLDTTYHAIQMMCNHTDKVGIITHSIPMTMVSQWTDVEEATDKGFDQHPTSEVICQQVRYMLWKCCKCNKTVESQIITSINQAISIPTVDIKEDNAVSKALEWYTSRVEALVSTKANDSAYVEAIFVELTLDGGKRGRKVQEGNTNAD